MKKRVLILSALCLFLMAATAVALAANRPAPFDFGQLRAGTVCPLCHDGIIYLAEGGEDRADERCPVTGYFHVVTVQTTDWACTGCGIHFSHASPSEPISFFCAESSCPDAKEWSRTHTAS